MTEIDEIATCVCSHLIRFDGKNWFHITHSLTLSCSNAQPKEREVNKLDYKK